MLYVNKETGELLTYNQMLKQFEEEYDGNDKLIVLVMTNTMKRCNNG